MLIHVCTRLQVYPALTNQRPDCTNLVFQAVISQSGKIYIANSHTCSTAKQALKILKIPEAHTHLVRGSVGSSVQLTIFSEMINISATTPTIYLFT